MNENKFFIILTDGYVSDAEYVKDQLNKTLSTHPNLKVITIGYTSYSDNNFLSYNKYHRIMPVVFIILKNLQ